MKKRFTHIVLCILAILSTFGLSAQDTTKVEFSAGADIVSRYIWRGADFGKAPAVQPTLSATYKNFTLGAWGSQSIGSNTDWLEADLFASYTFKFGLTVGIFDYHFPTERLKTIRNIDSSYSLISERSGDYFDFDNNHLLEANINYTYKNLSISANYMFHNAADDIYAEIGYNYKNFSVFVGGGNEMYTSDGEFNVCNTGFSISKDVKLSEKYKLPVKGSFIVNPDLEQVHMVFALSL